MYKIIFAKTARKRISVFLAVFVISGILMSGQMTNRSEEAALLDNGKTGSTSLSSNGQATMLSFSPVLLSDLEPWDGSFSPDLIQPVSARVDSDANLDAFFRRHNPTEEEVVTVENPKPQGFIYCSDIPISEELQKYTYDICQEKGLEYELVLALMWRESRFNVDAVNVNSNGTVDSGIMQINDVNKGWLREIGIHDLMDPEQNILAGTTILGNLSDKYGTHYGLMAYQYGEGGMLRQVEQGVTTNRQVQVLYNKRDDFKQLIQESI